MPTIQENHLYCVVLENIINSKHRQITIEILNFFKQINVRITD